MPTPGTCTLRALEDQPDPTRRLQEAVALLESLLLSVAPNVDAELGAPPMDLPARIRHHEKLFSRMPEVIWAVGIRDQVAAPPSKGPRPDELSIERAAGVALNAIRETLPVLPQDVFRQVTSTAPSAPAPQANLAAHGSATSASGTTGQPKHLGRFVVLGVAVVIVLLAIAQFAGIVSLRPLTREERIAKAAAQAADAAQREAQSVIRASLNTLLDKAKTAEAAGKRLLDEIEKYSTEVEPLMNNDEGRRVAADGESVAIIESLFEKPRPTRDAAERLVQRITDDLVRPLTTALQQTVLVQPDPSRAQQIDQASAEATRGAEAYKQLRTTLMALVSKSKGSSVAVPPDSPTLAAAIETVRQAHQLELQRAIQAEVDKERESTKAKLADAAREKERIAGEKLQQAELLKAKQIADAKEAELLRSKARDPKIISTYSQFLTPGHVYFKPTKGIGSFRSSSASPLSYTDLEAAGVLGDWRVFAHMCARRDYTYQTTTGFITLAFSENDRPGNWGYPSNAQEEQVIKNGLDLFKRLAPYWIADGKLLK